MMQKKILKYPNKTLNKKSKRVTIEQGKKTADNLIKRLSGYGVSAIQFGVAERVFVYRHGNFLSRHVRIVINPVIKTKSKNKCICYEGCLSCPEQKYVKRSKRVVVLFHDGTRQVQEELTGINAHIFQHEFDHLNGVLICDKNNKNVL